MNLGFALLPTLSQICWDRDRNSPTLSCSQKGGSGSQLTGWPFAAVQFPPPLQLQHSRVGSRLPSSMDKTEFCSLEKRSGRERGQRGSLSSGVLWGTEEVAHGLAGRGRPPSPMSHTPHCCSGSPGLRQTRGGPKVRPPCFLQWLGRLPLAAADSAVNDNLLRNLPFFAPFPSFWPAFGRELPEQAAQKNWQSQTSHRNKLTDTSAGCFWYREKLPNVLLYLFMFFHLYEAQLEEKELR